MYPSEHGTHETKTIKLLDIDDIKLKKDTFLSSLKVRGYKTYAISANPLVSPIYGFTGFDIFKEETYFTNLKLLDIKSPNIETPKKLKPLITKYAEKYGESFFKIGIAMLRDDPSNIKEIIHLPLVGILTLRNIIRKFKIKTLNDWPLEKGGMNAIKNFRSFNVKEPFFFFINFMEAHEPYIDKKSMDFNVSISFLKKQPSKSLVNLWKQKYTSGVEKALNYAYNLSKHILENYNNTIIIITSDHGQEFGEYDSYGHPSFRLDDELVHVPLIIHLPKGFDYVKSSSYASLVNVRNFINSASKNNIKSMEKLYSKTVYSESFASTIKSYHFKKNEINLKKLKKVNKSKYHKRMFKS